MKNNINHIIQKSIIEIEYHGIADGVALQKQIGDWYYDTLLPQLEAAFLPLSHQAYDVKLDAVEVNITINNGEWQDALAAKIAQQVKEQLERNTDKIKKLLPQENFLELLFYFLKNGYLPWWAAFHTKTDFLQAYTDCLNQYDGASFRNKLAAALQSETAQERFINTLTDDLFFSTIEKIFEGEYQNLQLLQADIAAIASRLANQKKQVHQLAKKALLQTISSDAKNVAQIAAEAFNGLLQQNNLIAVEQQNIPASALKEQLLHLQKESNNTTAQQKFSEAIYIANAGLIIVAPFLPAFFNRLGLLNDNTVEDSATALLLLHYMVSGNEHIAEFETVLSKILCGINIETVVDAPIALTTVQKKEADELLLSVIEHWSILKNTSIDGLRESFLHRNGKLSFQDNEWRLRVEQKPYDMLLQHLPWNISIIKLPFMKAILKVDWI